MPGIDSSFAEPFDLALVEFYKARPRWKTYKQFVDIGAEIGDPLAQYARAKWYLHGYVRLGIKRDLRKAVELLTESSRVFGLAAYDLAICKLHGAGTKRDAKVAFSLFSRSAKLGSLAAMEALAYCLESGTGTKKNLRAAAALLQRVSHWKRELQRIGAPLPSGPSRRARDPARSRSRRAHRPTSASRRPPSTRRS
jgi:TPR repeat protein